MRRRLRLFVLVTAIATLVQCDTFTPISLIGSITVTPSAALLDTAGDTIRFSATAQDRNGVTIPQAAVSWRSSDEDVATVDATGLAVAVGNGTTTITAFVGAVVGSATLEVFLNPNVGGFVAGQTYFGRLQYTEYQAGDLPIVISAPHGGTLEPDEIPDRTVGVTTQDRNTLQLARAVGAHLQQSTGGVPHVVVSHLHRVKLDANRELAEGANGNAFGERAWTEYHAFIEAARQTIVEDYGHGLFLDLHGHGHELQRLELGYLLSAEDLALPDNQLDRPSMIERSSIRALVDLSDSGFVALIRGPSGLGSLLDAGGFAAVPSGAVPHPGAEPYFTGGYSTARHGSRDGGTVSGIQIEAQWMGLRDEQTNRLVFATSLTEALQSYFATHYRMQLQPRASLTWNERLRPGLLDLTRAVGVGF